MLLVILTRSGLAGGPALLSLSIYSPAGAGAIWCDLYVHVYGWSLVSLLIHCDLLYHVVPCLAACCVAFGSPCSDWSLAVVSVLSSLACLRGVFSWQVALRSLA